jgi:hypothetical protein
MSLKTEEDEISCSECMDLLDQYVDLLDSGQDPAEVLPEIEQHLIVCNCCHNELEALVVAIRLAVESEE